MTWTPAMKQHYNRLKYAKDCERIGRKRTHKKWSKTHWPNLTRKVGLYE